MIYLLSQMGFIILLAAVAGGALGWAIHRLRNQQTISDLRRVIGQQQQQVKQSHTDVAMLAQDYDDLKLSSSSTIDSLKSENQQIPNLHQNLEKSQLLVRQLMQKHEAQIREYASENETLKSKVKKLDDREKALNKIQADLEIRRQEASASGEKIAHEDIASNSTDNRAENEAQQQQTEKTHSSVQPSTPKSEPDAARYLSKTADDPAKVLLKPHVNKTKQSIAELTAKAHAKAQQEKAQFHAAASAEDEHAVVDSENALDMSSDVSGEAGSLTVALAEADVVLASIDKRREQERDTDMLIEDDEVIDASEFDLEGAFEDDEELEPLFDPVDQHDDLQTIFGIGPLTERGLNQLGITSYSQLAELQRHDIEKIANALEIVPGKIERENWVGNARRQLEDVLEEL